MGRTKKRQRPHQQHGSHPSLPPLRGGVKKPAVHEHQHQLRQQQQQKRPRELWEGVTAELRQALEAGHQEGALLDSPLLAAGAGAGGSSYTLPGGRRVLVVSITAGVPGALQELRQSMTDRYIVSTVGRVQRKGAAAAGGGAARGRLPSCRLHRPPAQPAQPAHYFRSP